MYTSERRRPLLKDRGLFYRYPRFFGTAGTIIGVALFFAPFLYSLTKTSEEMEEIKRNFPLRIKD